MKLGYKLVFSNNSLFSKDISEGDFKQFKLDFPQIAEFLLNPEKLTSDQELMEKIQLDNWQTTALFIMNTLWKIKGANVFHSPVNPEKLGKRLINFRNPRLLHCDRQAYGLRHNQEETEPEHLPKRGRVPERHVAGLHQLSPVQWH